MFRTAIGDLFTYDAPAIGHGVNAEGVMGSGIAVAFRERWPHMHETYVRLCEEEKDLAGKIYAYKEEDGPWILNLFTQKLQGPNARLVYIAFALNAAKEFAEGYDISEIAIPAIGCGVGGLTLEEVVPVLKEIFEESSVTLTMVFQEHVEGYTTKEADADAETE